MARAYGSSAMLLLKRETAYGQAAAGDYIRIPFNRCTLGSEQGLIDDPVLGQGRDPYVPLQDAIMDEGEIVVPVDPRYIGLWLTGLLGPPTTDDDGGTPPVYTHEFASGKDSLPSYTIEVGHPQVPAYFAERVMVLSEHSRDAHDRPDANVVAMSAPWSMMGEGVGSELSRCRTRQ